MNTNTDQDAKETKRLVEEAATDFARIDNYLLTFNVNERSVTHKFAEHLQQRFPQHEVDCEYNRNHDDPKRLHIARVDVSSDDLEATTVFPDIIVHNRGTDTNLVVIEVKKSSNPDRGERDKQKLRAFKQELNYQVAYFIVFQVGGEGPPFTIEEVE